LRLSPLASTPGLALALVARFAARFNRKAMQSGLRNKQTRTSNAAVNEGVGNIKKCNGHPFRTICEIASQAMLREYGKTPFTCGTDVADSVRLIFPPYQLPPSGGDHAQRENRQHR